MEFTKQANELLKQAILETEQKNMLSEKAFESLDDDVVLHIVNYWYNHKTASDFLNEDGLDLEEYIELKLDGNI
jgi:hypothetical protein